VYVGLLLIALLAQLAGILFLFLDYNTFPDKAPPKISDRPPALAPSGPAPGAGAQGGAPGAGQQGGAPAPAPGVPPAGARGAQPGGGAQGIPPGRGGP
jgi:hypothetical protein